MNQFKRNQIIFTILFAAFSKLGFGAYTGNYVYTSTLVAGRPMSTKKVAELSEQALLETGALKKLKIRLLHQQSPEVKRALSNLEVERSKIRGGKKILKKAFNAAAWTFVGVSVSPFAVLGTAVGTLQGHSQTHITFYVEFDTPLAKNAVASIGCYSGIDFKSREVVITDCTTVPLLNGILSGRPGTPIFVPETKLGYYAEYPTSRLDLPRRLKWIHDDKTSIDLASWKF